MTDEILSLDATAQAELVRNGEASPAELVDAAIDAAERLNPEINAIIHEFYEQAREEAAGDLPDGPFRACRSCARTWAPGWPASRCTSGCRR